MSDNNLNNLGRVELIELLHEAKKDRDEFERKLVAVSRTHCKTMDEIRETLGLPYDSTNLESMNALKKFNL